MIKTNTEAVGAVWQALARHGYLISDDARKAVAAALSPTAKTEPSQQIAENANCSEANEDVVEAAQAHGEGYFKANQVSAQCGFRAGAAWQAARTQAPQADALREMDDELRFILGRPSFMFIQEANLFRSLGYEIPKKAEDEQAFFIHRWLGFYLRYGVEWRETAMADMSEHIARSKTLTAARKAE